MERKQLLWDDVGTPLLYTGVKGLRLSTRTSAACNHQSTRPARRWRGSRVMGRRRNCSASQGAGLALTERPSAGTVRVKGCAQVTRQLEEEKAALLERKRQEQAERRRKQEELDRILADNRRKVRPRRVRAAGSQRVGLGRSLAERRRVARHVRAQKCVPRAYSWGIMTVLGSGLGDP